MSQVLARRYAKAFVQVAQESAAPQKAIEQFLLLSTKILGQPVFLEILSRVTTTPEQRIALLAPLLEAVEADPAVSGIFRVLAQNGRLRLLAALVAAVRDLANQAAGIQVVQIQSPAALSRDEQQRLQKTLATVLHQQVQLELTEMPELLGGLRVRIGSTVYDGSLRGRMNRLRSELTKE